jgi:hypothetical protein
MAYTAGQRLRASTLQALEDKVFDPPRFQGRQIVSQSVTASTFTALTFTAEDLDSHGGHSTSSNTSRYTAQVAGWYLLSGKVAWAASTTGRRASAWAKNGSIINASQINYDVDSATGAEHSAATILVSLAVTDYVELQVFQDTAGALSTDVSNAAVQSYMAVLWVSS